MSRADGRPVPSRRRVAVVAGPLLVVAHLCLAAGWSVERVRGVVSTLAAPLLAAASVGVADDRTPTRDVGRTVEMTARAAPGPLADRLTCLRVAVVADALYAQFGVDVDVRFGVTRASGSFEAHAWVEHDGAVVAGDVANLDAYAVLDDAGVAT